MRLLVPALLVLLSAAPVVASPSCHGPRGGGTHLNFEIGNLSEADRAQFYEMRLRARGIDAANTRFWDGCIQTFVTENGRFTMRFYDPYTLEEVPVN